MKLASAALWVTLLGLAFWLAPTAAPEEAAQLQHLLRGELGAVNQSLFALFNLMGVWPMVMVVALRFDQSRWKWPFLLGSFALGAYVLLPWFILRPWGAPRVEHSWLSRMLSRRWVPVVLGLAFVALTVLFFEGDVR